MLYKTFFCIDKFYISIKSIIATSQLFICKAQNITFG